MYMIDFQSYLYSDHFYTDNLNENNCSKILWNIQNLEYFLLTKVTNFHHALMPGKMFLSQRDEEKRIQAEEKAKRLQEKEEEKRRKEEEKKKREEEKLREEKAKEEARLAEEQKKKDAENKATVKVGFQL